MHRRLLPGATLAPEDLAAFAHLRYVTDEEPGFARTRAAGGFAYIAPGGRRVRDARLVARLEGLAIPPAWKEVWICRVATGHLQATGRDSRRRKQYIYHPRWCEASNLAKFWRLRALGDALPRLRQAIARDLAGRRLTRERVLAGIVAALDATGIRIGNEEYVAQNGSYGLTTLRDRHVTLGRGFVELRFVGKGGLKRQAIVDQPDLVRLIKQARAVPGKRLFQFTDDCGRGHAVTATDVNEYLREITGREFTAKDFRTWKASAMAAGTLFEYRDVDRVTRRRRIAKTVVCEAASLLGNTPAVCRNFYIHPGLLESYEDGSLAGHLRQFRPRRTKRLDRSEQVFAQFLRRWEAAEIKRMRSA
jgi:DNA topoisomerase-1